MCACVCARRCTCVCMCAYVCALCAHVCTVCPCVCVCMHVLCPCVHVRVCVHAHCLCKCVHVCTCVHCMCVCAYVCALCVHTCVCACVCARRRSGPLRSEATSLVKELQTLVKGHADPRVAGWGRVTVRPAGGEVPPARWGRTWVSATLGSQRWGLRSARGRVTQTPGQAGRGPPLPVHTLAAPSRSGRRWRARPPECSAHCSPQLPQHPDWSTAGSLHRSRTAIEQGQCCPVDVAPATKPRPRGDSPGGLGPDPTPK